MKTFVLIDSELKMTSIPEDEDWQEIASELVQIQRSINWWLGDLLVYGEAQIGDEIYQYFPEETSANHLDRCASVSRAYPSGERNPRVTWTHHQLAMNLPSEVRRAALYRAEVEGMDTGKFRSYLTDVRAML